MFIRVRAYVNDSIFDFPAATADGQLPGWKQGDVPRASQAVLLPSARTYEIRFEMYFASQNRKAESQSPTVVRFPSESDYRRVASAKSAYPQLVVPSRPEDFAAAQTQI